MQSYYQAIMKRTMVHVTIILVKEHLFQMFLEQPMATSTHFSP